MLQVIQSYRTGVLEVADVPPPALRDGTLLVRTVASVVSAGTERHLVEMARKGLLGKVRARPDLVRRVAEKVRADGLAEAVQQVRQRLDTPVALGYSAAGTVVAAGGDIAGFRVGDLVACGGQGVAVHAEMLCVPPTLAVPVPEGVAAEHAAFAMIGAIALNSARLAGAQQGEWVAVVGLGMLGLLAVGILRAGGFRVVGLDIVPEKLDLARSLGAESVVRADAPDADAAVLAQTGGRGVDAVVITAASHDSLPLELAAKIARTRGRIVATGLVGLEIPRHLFFERELSLTVSRASGPGLYDLEYEVHGVDYPFPFVRWTHSRNMAEFLRLVSSADVRLEPLITHRFPIARAVAAYDVLERGGPIGILLQYPAEAPPPRATVRLRRPDPAPSSQGSVGVGLIGAGLFARTTLLPALKRVRGVRLRVVATASGTSAHHVARRFGFDEATSDIDHVLGDSGVSCVIIATRHDSHARLVVAALRADKDVFVEKPLAMTVAEVAEVAEAWAGSSGRLMVGFNRRHSRHACAARDFAVGAFGPAILRCRVNAGDLPPGSWVSDPSQGGDRIRGELCHFVDLAHFLLGGEAVAVEARAIKTRADGSSPHDVVVAMHFGDGSVADLVYTSLGHRSLPREAIEVFRGGRVACIENFRVTRFYGPRAPRRVRTRRQDRGYPGELAGWFEALRTGGPAPVAFRDYAASTLVTLTVNESLKENRRIEIDWSVLDKAQARLD